MKNKEFLKLVLVLSVSFFSVLGFLSNTMAKSKFEVYPVPKECMDQVRKEGSKLTFYNWAEWWPEQIFDGFSKEFGVEVKLDHFADLAEMVTKFKLNPRLNYDLANAGVKEFVELKELGVVQKLNHDWIPNVNKYLPEVTKNIWYDPGYQYTAENDRVFLCYGYNSKYVDPNDPRVGSWKLLFEPGNDYKGRVVLIDNMFYVIGCALKYLGLPGDSDDEADLMKAKELLLRQKPAVMAYSSWPKRLVLEEEAYLFHSWTGDVWFFHRDAESIRCVLPSEGTIADGDMFCIPKNADHPATAHLFINYCFRPEINALLIDTIGHPPNHTATAELLSDEHRKWPGTVVSEEYLEKCSFRSPKSFTGKGLELRTKIWEELKR